MSPSLSRNDPVFSVSIAAQMAGMHAQTVRQYDRLGLVVASRTKGGGRRYSLNDIEAMQEIQQLSQEEGINLAGIKRILQLAAENERLEEENLRLRAGHGAGRRVFTADTAGDVVAVPLGTRLRRAESAGALVVWRPQR